MQIPDSNFKEPKIIRCRAVIASKAKQSIKPRKERMDCFASLAMTWNSNTAVNKLPDGQITSRRREQNPLVSRTRCSVLHDAPQSRDLYCRLLPCEMDPGSAAHRCALRSIRGTTGADMKHPVSLFTAEL